MRPCTNEIDSLSLRIVPASAPVSMQLELLFRSRRDLLPERILPSCSAATRRYVKIREKRNYFLFLPKEWNEQGVLCFLENLYRFYRYLQKLETVSNNERNESMKEISKYPNLSIVNSIPINIS